MKVIGTCSICRGPVVEAGHCLNCGAIKKQNYGPTIPMVPKDNYPIPYPRPRPYERPRYPWYDRDKYRWYNDI